MLDVRWRKVWRDLRLHPSRTVLVVLAIVVGLAGAGAVLDTWSLMRQVTREEYRASKPPSATMRLDSLTSDDLAAVRSLASVAWVEARRSVTATVTTSTDSTPRTLVLVSREDFSSTRIGRLTTNAGEWPPRDGHLIVEHSSVEFAGVSLGDSVRVQLADAPAIWIPVAGIARDVGLPPGWMEHVVYAFASPATMALVGSSATFNSLELIVRDSTLDQAGVRRVVFDVKRALEARGRHVVTIDVPVPGEHAHAGQINSLLYTQGAFGALALLVSGILVVNLIGAMLAGQVREIGVMKAIGASPAQIGGMYFGVAFALGCVASAIAIPLAAVIGRAYANFTAEILNFSATGFAIPTSAFLAQLVVGLVFPVAAAAIPVMRGCRISVNEALGDVGLGTTRSAKPDGFITRLTAVGGLRRPMLLSMRNAFRKRQRMTLTLLSLAMGGGVYMGALNLRQSVRGAVDMIFSVQRFDMSARLVREGRADSLEALVRALPGVAGAEAWGAQRATVEHADSTLGNVFSVSAVPVDTKLLAPTLLQGRWLAANDQRALVVNSRLLATDSSLHVGDSVSLKVSGKSERWLIVGAVETGPMPIAYASRAVVSGQAGAQTADRLVIASTLRGPGAQLELLQRVRATLTERGFPVENTQMLSESRFVFEDHLLMVAGFLGVMGQLMIVVGGLALASTMGMAVLERTREIGVLKAIGAQHRAILSMIQVEGLVIALLGWALALPLSVPMSVLLARAFSRIMMPLPILYLPSSDGVIRWLAVAVTVSIAACVWPAWRAMRITTRAALSYE